MIEVRQLEKSFRSGWRKRFRAVDGVSFSCTPGRVFGLLGPNGAGKTTTLRLLSTAIRPTGGTAIIGGHDVRENPENVRRSIGFLSGTTGLYGRLTPREVLTYFGVLHSMSRKTLKQRIDYLSQLLGMEDYLDRPCDKLSTGMKQKVNIARSVIHDPSVLIFDEPTSGLDVLASRTIVDFIRQCRTDGRTVLFSTHIMSEVERLCDEIAVIHKGRIFYTGTVPDFRSHYGDDLEEAFVRLLEGNSEP